MADVFDKLIEEEGWEIKTTGKESFIIADGKEFPYAHPFSIHSKLFREEPNPNLKYKSLRAMHRYAWPEYEAYWNFWDERRFRTLCEGYTYISYAGGASTGKSHCAARLALLYWMCSPNKRTVIVASTTLASLSVRIWGYITRLANEMSINFPLKYYSGNAPRILFNKNDPIHGMYAVAAGKGTEEKAISNWIGRHPKEGMMIVLDEATDLDPVILKSLPNLESGGIDFKCLVIGNSLSKFDLHGSLSTPAAGWKSIDPTKDVQWPTTQKNGICLFFSCHESPAIHEWQPDKKALLSKIFITKAAIEEKKKLYGADSDSFYRFVLGFWRDSAADETVISKQFLDEFSVRDLAEWSGIAPLQVVAGLDPAFSQGGDQCVLRLAVLGQDVRGQMLLDYRKDDLLFKIPISAKMEKSAEIQIADKVIEILRRFNCPLGNLCVDANGQGRALAEVIRLRANSVVTPLKIYSTRQGNTQQKSFDVIIKTNYELWLAFRDFIQTNQLRGLDTITIAQITSRLVEVKAGKQFLETKQAFKTRIGAVSPGLAHSPDEADAAALALQVAIIRYGFRPGQRHEVRNDSFEMEKYLIHQRIMAEEQKHNEARSPIADFSCDLYDVAGQLMNVFGNWPD